MIPFYNFFISNGYTFRKNLKMKNTLLLVLILFYTSCSKDSENVEPRVERFLSSIEISSSNGNSLFLSSGSTLLSATGRDQFNNPINIPTLQWTSNNNNVSIDNFGNVTPQATGVSIITASSGNVESNYSITILDDPIPSDFYVYVCDIANFDTGPYQILKYDENGNNPEVFINSNLSWPQDILFLEDQGIVLISNLSSGRITKYNSDTGGYLGNFATGIAGPTRMKIGPDNLLYVLQWNNTINKVKRYELDGTPLGDFTSIGVPQSIGLDWDEAGNLYVSSYSDDIVRKYDLNGNDLGLFVNSNLEGPTNIWFDDSGNLFVVDYNGGAVKKYDANGSYLGVFISGLSKAEGVAFMENGNILIGNGNTSSVKLYKSDGTYIDDFISSGSGGLITPNAVIIR